MQQANARTSSTGAVLMGVGGLIAIIGSVLSWVKVTSTRPVFAGLNRTFAGTSSGEGKAVLVMGVIAIAAAVLAFVMPRREVLLSLGIVTIVASLVVVFFTVRDIGQTNRQIREGIQSETGRRFTDGQVKVFLRQLGIKVQLDTGIYVALLGGLIMLGGGIATTATAPTEEADSRAFQPGPGTTAPA